MSINKGEIFQLPADKKRQLAFELLDSIDEEFLKQPFPDWKKKLIKERLQIDMERPGETTQHRDPQWFRMRYEL